MPSADVLDGLAEAGERGEEFPWHYGPAAWLSIGATPVAYMVYIFLPEHRFVSLLMPLSIMMNAWTLQNSGRSLRVDARGVRLLERTLSDRPKTRWHIAPDELRAVERDGTKLRLISRTGRPRTISIARTPLGGWGDPAALLTALEASADAP